MPSGKLSGFLDDRLASLLNQACNYSLYERGVLEGLRVINTTKNLYCQFLTSNIFNFFFNPQAVAFNRDQTKLVKGSADKLKTWAIKLLALSKTTISRDGNYFSMITSTLIINTYSWKTITVVLDEFPE